VLEDGVQDERASVLQRQDLPPRFHRRLSKTSTSPTSIGRLAILSSSLALHLPQSEQTSNSGNGFSENWL
jgi:hypothetical protein